LIRFRRTSSSDEEEGFRFEDEEDDFLEDEEDFLRLEEEDEEEGGGDFFVETLSVTDFFEKVVWTLSDTDFSTFSVFSVSGDFSTGLFSTSTDSVGMYSLLATSGLTLSLFSRSSRYIIGIRGNFLGREIGRSVGILMISTSGFLDISVL
jgi:hypothetical protein